MKVCVPAEDESLDAAVDPRLGRAQCFVLVDSETGEMLGSVANAQNKQAAAGAGIQAGQTIAESGAEAVLCAHVGPKAHRVLTAAGVDVYTGASGTVAESVAALAAGNLSPAEEANVEGHWAP